MDPWLTLAFAGLFEVGFTTCLKLEERSKGFIVPFLICAGISFTRAGERFLSVSWPAEVRFAASAADYLKLPKRIDNRIPVKLSPQEMKQYKTMEAEQLLHIDDEDVVALNAAAELMNLTDVQADLLRYLKVGVGLWKVGSSHTTVVKHRLSSVEKPIVDTDSRMKAIAGVDDISDEEWEALLEQSMIGGAA